MATSFEQLASGNVIYKMLPGDEYMVKDMTYLKYFNDKPYDFTNQSETEARARWARLDAYRTEIHLYFLALENAAKNPSSINSPDLVPPRFLKYLNFQDTLQKTIDKKIITSSDAMGLLMRAELDTQSINEREFATQQWFFREMFPIDKDLIREVLDRRDRGDTRDVFRDMVTNTLTNASYVGAAVVVGASVYGAASVIGAASASTVAADAAATNATLAAGATESGTIAGSTGLLSGTASTTGGLSLGAEGLLTTATTTTLTTGSGLASLGGTLLSGAEAAVATAATAYTTSAINNALNPKKSEDNFSYIPTPQLSVGDNLKTNAAILIGGGLAVLLAMLL